MRAKTTGNDSGFMTYLKMFFFLVNCYITVIIFYTDGIFWKKIQFLGNNWEYQIT